MDAIGFVLIVVGAALMMWQFFYLISAVAVFAALAGRANKANVNFWAGSVGIALAAAGALVMHFG